MNKPQRIVLSVGLIIVALMAIYPPWTSTLNGNSGIHHERPHSYGLIFYPPETKHDLAIYGVKIDFGRLAVQMLSVISITAVAFILSGIKKKTSDNVPPGEKKS